MRIKGLDILRGIAILLVLIRHGELENSILYTFGWLGVDLFFVLSGVLVSGLLFKEYTNSGKFNISRFLIRRGFKIYPSYYIFIFSALFLDIYLNDATFHLKEILPEVFFIQNYTDGIWKHFCWLHTWSLAVEEHFYFILAILTFIITKTKIIERKKIVIITLFLLFLISFLVRFYNAYPHRNDEYFPFIESHLRSDGLIIGVLLSFILHFTNIYKRLITWKKTLLFVAILLISPGFYFTAGGFFMNTIGLSLVNIGFGIITLFAMQSTPSSLPYINKLFKVPLNLLCFVGKNSYSIYLWHLMALDIINYIFNEGKTINFVLYFILSMVMGISAFYIIEKPFLRLRERVVK